MLKLSLSFLDFRAPERTWETAYEPKGFQNFPGKSLDSGHIRVSCGLSLTNGEPSTSHMIHSLDTPACMNAG